VKTTKAVNSINIHFILFLYFSGILSLTGSVFESAVYTWIAVFTLPVNAALNPFLYTFSKHITEQVIHFVDILSTMQRLAMYANMTFTD
jgi:hypothetical protein